ncbi:hypothetical protein HMPREF0658_0121 [Hoylesella marshii DSM 16973 = JCM 13450]|uniref:Uncharacterized protein n=1 Tax=Hoylesella marshii DSM 16973 = JCM 13450 TaxID=862515 RepID=E0NPM0_9BACT|nr:hypothetical protein HMPREF0658_0121 [Hoylesella marshii DSM 16973 = JCM 13450]
MVTCLPHHPSDRFVIMKKCTLVMSTDTSVYHGKYNIFCTSKHQTS